MVKDYNANSTSGLSSGSAGRAGRIIEGAAAADQSANLHHLVNGGSSVGSSGSVSADSEDDEDPRTPTSVSSQGSQGYDSTASDFVDIEGFQHIPDTALPELNLQVRVRGRKGRCGLDTNDEQPGSYRFDELLPYL